MDYLDKQLQRIQEDDLQEIDPFTLSATAAVGTAYLVGAITTYLIAASQMKSRIKVDKKLTKRLNEILDSKGKWIIHIYPDPSPNAFAIGGRNVFITTGLLKVLTHREVEAVLLHEVYHNKDKHIYKKLAYTHSFAYLIIFIAMSVSAATGAYPLGILTLFLLIKVADIAFNRVAGRRFEIKADEHAIKFGYGKELISSLKKLEKILAERMKKIKCGTWCQFERKISEAIDEHPPAKKRVEIILRKSQELGRLMKTTSFGKIKDFVTKVFKENG